MRDRGARAIALAVCVTLLYGCASTVERAYYAPLGVDFGESIASWQHESRSVAFTVRSQGIYLNRVDGVDVRTAHFQIDVTCTRPSGLVLPVDGVRLDVLSADGRSRTLQATEVWSGQLRVHKTLVVEPWSRRPFDVFFDDAHVGALLPDALRLRLSYRIDDVVGHEDCQFLRIAPDDPRLPARGDVRDTAFGVYKGYYLPGRGDLGTRRLRETIEMRRHYLFHDPDSWIR